MKREGSLPHSQVPANCLYPEPARSSPYPTSHFLKIHLNNILLFWFSLQLLSEIFLILRRIQRRITINAQTSPCKVPVILVRLTVKHEFSRRVFYKSLDIKFHGIPFGGSRILSFAQTDRHDEVKWWRFTILRTRLRTGSLWAQRNCSTDRFFHDVVPPRFAKCLAASVV